MGEPLQPGTFDDGEELESLEAEQPETEEEGEQESLEEGAESAPAEGEKVVFNEKQQEVFDKTIGEKVRKQREAERRAQQLEEQLEALRKQLPQEQKPVIPPMPDPYDDDYHQKVKERDEAIQKAVAWDVRSRIVEEQKRQTELAKQQEEYRREAESVESYAKKAKAFGITTEELQAAGSAVGSYGLSKEMAMHIISEEKGPLITAYLARRPLEVEKINSMSPYKAAVYISTVVAQKAGNGRKSSTAPEPPETLGSGGAPKAERGPKGATFE